MILIILILGIATAFATQYPEKILSLSLIAPAGLLKKLPVIAYVLQTPIIGPVIWYAFGRKVLERISESSFHRHSSQAVVRAKIMTADHIRNRKFFFQINHRSWIPKSLLFNCTIFSLV